MQTKQNLVPYLAAAKQFEHKWQVRWQQTNALSTDPVRLDQPKQVVLDFFPYPSGIGLHVGHPLGYIATDVFARLRRMQGYNVLHSMGFDSFGLPAEQYAVQNNRHPRDTTNENVANMLLQLRLMGLGHDENRRFLTSEPDYYKWTQWIFLVLFESAWDPVEEWTDSLGRTVRGRAVSVDALRRMFKDRTRCVDDDGRVVLPSSGCIVEEKDVDIFIDRNRLAQLREVDVNWCPMLGTVLANEEVTPERRSERGDFPVYRRPLRQWTLRIADYADRLLNDLPLLSWPAGILEMQRNWIGARNGAQINFAVEGRAEYISVFTTRPDTVYGVTYVGLASSHPLVRATVSEADNDVLQQISLSSKECGDDVPFAVRGLKLPIVAFHPLTGQRLSLLVCDYVLADYGTGAVMGVPAHDQRDFEFAKHFGLSIVPVLRPDQDWLAVNAPVFLRGKTREEILQHYLVRPGDFASAYAGYGPLLDAEPNPATIWNLTTDNGRANIIDALERNHCGRQTRTYRLRDWIFSRQRYWGEPFPVVYDTADERVYALAESELPVKLPAVEDFSPITSKDPDAPVSTPLSKALDWLTVWGHVGPDGRVRLCEPDNPGAKRFRRDTNTMPNWAGSCWYYLRYFDPRDDSAFVAPDLERYWGGGSNAIGSVDLYVGGAEHAVLHLLYARFWHKVLYDRNLVSTPEPFARLYSQGMITADAYQDNRGFYVDPRDVKKRDEDGSAIATLRTTGERLTVVKGKMGKRYKNGIPPQDVTDRHSVDAYRCYMMFLGPLDATSPWREEPIVGIDRFLSAVWQLAHGSLGDAIDPGVDCIVHRSIRDVTTDIENLRLNTALSTLMKLENALSDQAMVPARSHVEVLVKLLAPFAPHLAEELFSTCFVLPEGILTVAKSPWPAYDPAKIVIKRQAVIIQINGKVRNKIDVEATIDESALIALVERDRLVEKHLKGKRVVNVIHVNRIQSRLVNFVTE